MPLSKSPTAAILLIVAAILACNAPLLDTLWGILRLDELANSPDAHTHYLRLLHARDLYLPSGHHWGWDPFWFQGFVPFLLYPHLVYVALAGASYLPGIDPAPLLNAFTVAIYLALPLAAALPLLRSRGTAVALIVAVWVADLSTLYGAGLRGVLNHGLISQQTAMCLFALFAADLVVTGRRERAAVWLGLMALVHVHAMVIAALVWAVEGVLSIGRLAEDRRGLAGWLVDSMVAASIASPTLLGIALGWSRLGGSSGFPHPEHLLELLFKGWLVGPWPIVVAIVTGASTSALLARSPQRVRLLTALVVGLVMVGVSLQHFSYGSAVLNRLMRFMLRLRTLPFAYVWLAMVAAAGWPRIPARLRMALVVLTVVGVPLGWSHAATFSRQIGTAFPRGVDFAPVGEARYLEVLEWIRADVGAETTSVALVIPPRTKLGRPLRHLDRVVGLPVLGGHGIELTSVRNSRLTIRPEAMKCEEIERQIRDYAVGYLVGGTQEHRQHFQSCFGRQPDYESGWWWAYATRRRWHTLTSAVYGFARNRTWTELHWYLTPQQATGALRLPLANTAPWIAYADETEIPLATTADGMMNAELPAGTRHLILRYRGFPGEWPSVGVSVAGLLFGVVRVRRRRGTSVRRR